jgi:hypothetical protein
VGPGVLVPVLQVIALLQSRASNHTCVCGGAGAGWVEFARPGKGVLGLYGNVKGDCVTAVRPIAADRPTTGHADAGDALEALLT